MPRPMRKKPRRSRRAKIKNSKDVINCDISPENTQDANLGELEPQKLKKKKLTQVILPIKVGYKCDKCSKRFTFEKSFNEHVHNEHYEGPGAVKCYQCNISCPGKDVLVLHIANVHERMSFECPHCTKKFARQAHVLRHMSQKGCGGNVATIYPCEICDASFTRKDNLMVHLRLKHIAKNEFSCKLCPYQTKNFSKLIIHRQHSHGELKFQCDLCGKITQSRAAITKHLEIHGEKKFSCDVCGYSTFTIEVMRRHVLTHVVNKPHKCPMCDQSYIQRSQLLRHLEKHDSKFYCVECRVEFPSKSRLIMHKRVHNGTDNLYCPFKDCPYSKNEFSNESLLENHIKTHFEDKTYKCEVCSKTFHSETNMRRHLSTHLLERPRRCMYCVAARAYVRGEQLVRHVRKQHPAIFREHLDHVRQVVGTNLGVDRVKKSEIESILMVLDAVADRILDGYGPGVLYGGMQDEAADEASSQTVKSKKKEDSPLMSEEELADSLGKLLEQLVDKETLECFGWPNESVDDVLEKVIENCGAKAADRDKWSRVQRLRENTKHLFVFVIDDKNISRMLHTHTIDQTVKHILTQVTDTDPVK